MTENLIADQTLLKYKDRSGHWFIRCNLFCNDWWGSAQIKPSNCATNENKLKGWAKPSSSLPSSHLAVCCEAREHHIVFFKLNHHVFCFPVHIPSLKESNIMYMADFQLGLKMTYLHYYTIMIWPFILLLLTFKLLIS